MQISVTFYRINTINRKDIIMSKTIRINDDVYMAIQHDAIPFEDTPDTVLRRWASKLGLLATAEEPSDRSTLISSSTNRSTNTSPVTRLTIIRERPPHNIKSITQEEVIPYIIKYLKSVGGRDDKKTVEQQVYFMLENIFSQSYYQKECRDKGKRWEKHVQWARDKAYRKGLIKSPQESGRGIWELTDRGNNFNTSHVK